MPKCEGNGHVQVENTLGLWVRQIVEVLVRLDRRLDKEPKQGWGG